MSLQQYATLGAGKYKSLVEESGITGAILMAQDLEL